MDYRLEQLRFELREDPSSRIFFKLGEHLRREGELDEAIGILRAGLERYPRYVAAWVSLGRALLVSGDSAGASEALGAALELDPDNAVAASFAGEAAVANEDWVGAVKALKRARGLIPQDDALDERIAFVEGKLAGLGLLELPRSSSAASRVAVETHPGGDEPFAVGPAGDTGEWEEANDVFAAGWVEDEDVVSLIADDVVSEAEAEEAETETETETEAEDLPLPTMTLARLAIDQGDLDLAEKTLRSVLDADPENREAARLLERLIEAPPHPGDSHDTGNSAGPRIRALQEWLKAAKLGAERLDS